MGCSHDCCLGRSVDEVCLERVRAYQTTEPFKKSLRKRQVSVESSFARSAKTGIVCGAFAGRAALAYEL
jgi:hypothetical protein